nr:DUF4238 domain-containing protein [Pseudaminobacter soli]
MHHYVPQFHLRRFTDDTGRLWTWEKQADRIFPTAPGRIAAATQFYRLTQYEADGHDPLTMQKQLSNLEGEVALISGQWLERLEDMATLDVVPIPRINRGIFALYLAVQFLRTADTRGVLSALIEAGRGTPVNERELREAHDLTWDQRLIGPLAKRFRRSIWIFARNDSTTPLITSDNPIAFSTDDNRQWLRAGILSRQTYLVYPLSPRVVLYCHPRHDKFRKLGKFADCLSPVRSTRRWSIARIAARCSWHHDSSFRTVVGSTPSERSRRRSAPTSTRIGLQRRLGRRTVYDA